MSEDWGWEHHEREQRLRWLRVSMIQKLQWLEDTQRMVAHLQRSREKAMESEPGGGNRS